MALVCRAATAADRPGLFRLFEAAFGQAADPATWEWKYDRNPHPATSVVSLLDGEIVGFFGGVGTRYRGQQGDLPGIAAADVMTHPLHRRLGRFSLFVETGLEFFRIAAAAGAPFVFGFPNERARLIGERSLDYRSVEPSGLWTRAVGSPSLLGRIRRRLLRPRTGTRLSPAHDALAEALHARPGWRTDRSRATLDWRLAPHAGAAYRIVEILGRQGASRGYAAVRLLGERALLVDIQVLDEASGDVGDLLEAVRASLEGTSATRLELRAASFSPLAIRLAAEFGFALEPSDCHFEIRPFDPAFDALAAGRAFDYRFSDHEIF
jgi:hypothetical protein